MDSVSDWASKEFVKTTESLDRSGFAFEFLRRNFNYQADYKKFLKARSDTTGSSPQFSKKWGLVFSG